MVFGRKAKRTHGFEKKAKNGELLREELLSGYFQNLSTISLVNKSLGIDILRNSNEFRRSGSHSYANHILKLNGFRRSVFHSYSNYILKYILESYSNYILKWNSYSNYIFKWKSYSNYILKYILKWNSYSSFIPIVYIEKMETWARLFHTSIYTKNKNTILTMRGGT